MLLADSLRHNALALNAIRLGLALVIIVDHSFPLGGYGPGPSWFADHLGMSLGGPALGGFFAISGMLVTMSAARKTAWQYLVSRVRRLYPLYLTVLVAGAAVVGPIIYAFTHRTMAGYLNIDPGGPVVYVLRNAFVPLNLQYGINDVFADTPWGLTVGGSVINGSLWTLPIEVRCYVIALLVVLVGRRVGLARTAAGAALIAAAFVALDAVRPDLAAGLLPEYLPIGVFALLFVFCCGVLAGALAGRIRLTAPVVGAASAVLLVATVVGGSWFATLGLACLCLLIPALAAVLPLRRATILRNDLSYGTYVWAFPIQQSLAFFGVGAAPAPMFMVASAALTLPVAAASWWLVEQPILRRPGRS